MWIYEYDDWPNFTWQAERLSAKLADIRHRQGPLLGRMENLGFDLKREASLEILTTDVVKSSAIEGENLTLRAMESRRRRRVVRGSSRFFNQPAGMLKNLYASVESSER
jgi:Fic family protein